MKITFKTLNRIIIYIIVLLFFSCTETKKKTPPEVILHDSTSYYFELYNNPKLKDYEKNILNMRMFNYWESIQNSKEKREKIDKVILNYCKDGALYKCHIKGFPVFDTNGKLTNFIAFEKIAA